jgi:hypothetical protein
MKLFLKQSSRLSELEEIQMTVTPEGLRIEFLETEAGLFFEPGSPRSGRVMGQSC